MLGISEAKKALPSMLVSLLEELRHRGWTLMRWGTAEEPELLAAFYRWDRCTDVFVLRSEQSASSYRVPSTEQEDIIAPKNVLFQQHADSVTALRSILRMPPPGAPGAPDELRIAEPHCRMSAKMPSAITVRPLKQP